ncbi:MAG: tetratricopeptide (TPR) repeat protein [Rhodothermales bacterium]|jgi:tetratricopeptide (TPR) repeat protein
MKSAALIAALAVLLYGNTFGHNYALDDQIVITGNSYTLSGIAGIGSLLSTDSFTGFVGDSSATVAGGRYRPLSLVSFAIEQAIFGGNPYISHIINVLLFALSSVLIYYLLLHLRTPQRAAFVCALLFVVHPIHTEVVANIKGRDELLALGLGLLALRLVSARPIAAAFALFAALLAKEHAIVFLPLAALALLGESHRRLIPMAISTALFLIIRQLIVGNRPTVEITQILNDPFLHASLAEHSATAFACLSRYLKLLVWPHPLTVDYYPFHISLSSWTSPLAWFGLLSTLAIAISAICGLRKRWPAALPLLLYLLPMLIIANLFFSVGTFMAERFLYLPSLGFCWLLALASQRLRTPQLVPLLGLVLIAGSILTVRRNFDWKDNFSLYVADSATSPRGLKSNAGAGAEYLMAAQRSEDPVERKALLEHAVRHLSLVVSLDPSYLTAAEVLAQAQFELDPATGIATYEAIRKANSNRYNVNHRLGRWYQQQQDYAKAVPVFRDALAARPESSAAKFNLAVALLGLGPQQAAEALPLLQDVTQERPDFAHGYKNLGLAHYHLGDLSAAIEALTRAVELEPSDARLVEFLERVRSEFAKANQQ